MLERNKALKFSKDDINEIQKIQKTFTEIAMKMGVQVETGMQLTTNEERIELYYVLNGEKKCNFYGKNVVSTRLDLLNEIKAGLFGELNKIEVSATKWISCDKEKPAENLHCKVWAGFLTPWGNYVRRVNWCHDHFEWDNGKRMTEEPDAWQPYVTPVY